MRHSRTRKPTVVDGVRYPSQALAIEALDGRGVSRRDIAARLDIATATVAGALWYAKRRANGARRATRPAEANGRTVLFPVDVLDRLVGPARARGISANELARRIVETAIDDGIIDAVLDDDSSQSRSAPVGTAAPLGGCGA